jgi:hypothetical protein
MDGSAPDLGCGIRSVGRMGFVFWEIQIAGKRSFDVAKAPSGRELLARLRKFRGTLPAGFKYDRLEANERG